MKFKPPAPNRKTSFVDAKRDDKILENKRKNINFSFKYFTQDEDFHIRHDDAMYFQKIIERLKGLCGLSYMDLHQNSSRALRFHRIDWGSKSVARSGFDIPGSEDLCEEAYLFSVSANEHGRIMGFFTDNITFNVVWFDKNHDLYD